MKHTSNVIEIRRLNVIIVISRLGEGTEDDPVRHIIEYYHPKGHLLFRDDSMSNWEKVDD